MFAVYKYNAGATMAQIGADVIAILTGTTDVNTLSASCDKANSSILTTYDVAGWTVHDAAAATNRQVIKAPCVDGSTYKYVGLDFNTANIIGFGGCETWNASTHAGTNMAAASGTTACTSVGSISNTYLSTSSGGTLYIYASARGLLIAGKLTGSIGGHIACIEHSRDSANMAVGRGYPCWVLMAQPSISRPIKVRAKSGNANGDVVGSANTWNNCALVMPASSVNSGLFGYPNSVFRDSITEAQQYTFWDFRECGFASSGSSTAEVAEFLGKILMKGGYSYAGTDLDETTVGGITYIRLGSLFQPFFWAPRG